MKTWNRPTLLLLMVIGPACALAVWLSSLSFVPVPWPDDSAFYFVAKELFRWPPHWVMLPQAPFEPTYRIWNFNTMPLYPLMIGLGRWIGIDGSLGIKFWPLSFWALSGSFLAAALYRAGLSALLTALVVLTMGMDPALRWASVLARPESLIGLCGIVLVTGLSLGWFTSPESSLETHRKSSRFWDPVAALLAIGALAHFNAVHLLFAVVAALALKPQRMMRIAAMTTLYLSPWIFTVALKPRLFIHQMTLQWERLAGGNGWLGSVHEAIKSLFQNMGSPEDWPAVIEWASMGLWILIFISLIIGLLYPLSRTLIVALQEKRLPFERSLDPQPSGGVSLLPAGAWVLGSIWLWHNKPEVWFTYYIHLSLMCFTGLALLKLWKQWTYQRQAATHQLPAHLNPVTPLGIFVPLCALCAFAITLLSIFSYVNISQARSLSATSSWHWSTYQDYVECVDRHLVRLESQRPSHASPFQVWAPTYPDITIEISRRHPEWDLTRTNDFWSRQDLAVRHGWDVDAVVVPEIINQDERDIDAPWNQHPEVHSVWMEWKDYFLNRLWIARDWKPNRHLCQKGRWQAFLFSK